MEGRNNEQESNSLYWKLLSCVCTPIEAAKNVKTSVFSSVEIHAEDGRKDEQHHGKVKHHYHCSLQEKHRKINAILWKRVRIGLYCTVCIQD